MPSEMAGESFGCRILSTFGQHFPNMDPNRAPNGMGHPMGSHGIPWDGMGWDEIFLLKYPMGWDGMKAESRGMGWDQSLVPWDFLFSHKKMQVLFCRNIDSGYFITTVNNMIYYILIVALLLQHK